MAAKKKTEKTVDKSSSKSSKSKSKTKPKAAGVKKEEIADLALIPIREVAPIPGLVLPVYISAGPSTEAVAEILQTGATIVLTLQEGDVEDEPGEKNLRRMGALAEVVHTVVRPNGDMKVRVYVQDRAYIKSFDSFEPRITVTVDKISEQTSIKLTEEVEQDIAIVKDNFALLAEAEPALEEHIYTARDIIDPGALADLVTSALLHSPVEAQEVLEELDPGKRIGVARQLLLNYLDGTALRHKAVVAAQQEMSEARKDELLRAQLRQIQAELGETNEYDDELADLKSRLKKTKLSPVASAEAEKQLRRISHLHPESSEAALSRTYLEWLLEVPWKKRTKDKLDLKLAKEILDRDHYGLEKAKERILDFLGVRKLQKNHRGPVLLLAGPPGVGKTSLGRSIAEALGRKFVRVSVGGLRDEAELRGHRRTYVGALPGRIIQGLKNAGTKNPVFMLDELDKIGADFRGDPSAVLLEILDPEQNKEFEDHYLNLPFDLSEVLFIGTANITDSITQPLLDRMEVLELSGYTTEEKLNISQRYLAREEKKYNGLEDYEIELTDAAVKQLITGYTRESGVRELRRTIGSVFRKTARKVAEGEKAPKKIDAADIEDLLGPVKFLSEQLRVEDAVGVVTGLAWTSVGGETLLVEVTITKGKGSLSLTGQLGDVMRESAQAAMTYVLANAEELGIDPDFYENSNVHIHVPHGAIPKDGPSAGVSIATAIVSVLTGRPVSRDVAMTGEITLRGNVLAIGGLKEKALAALRVGAKRVVFPKENERDLRDFPQYLLDHIEFIPVESVAEVFKVSLLENVDEVEQRKVSSTKIKTKIDTKVNKREIDISPK